MDKPELIINGLRAADFVLVKKYGRNILNDLIVIKCLRNSSKPLARHQFTIKSGPYKYSLNETLIWRGLYVGIGSRIYHIYIDHTFSTNLIETF